MPYTGRAQGDSTGAQRANAGAFLPAAMPAQALRDRDVDAAAGVLLLPGHVGVGEARLNTLDRDLARGS